MHMPTGGTLSINSDLSWCRVVNVAYESIYVSISAFNLSIYLSIYLYDYMYRDPIFNNIPYVSISTINPSYPIVIIWLTSVNRVSLPISISFFPRPRLRSAG